MNSMVTAGAHPNLAFVKYWGKSNESLNIPANSSLSVNLSSAVTITSVEFCDDYKTDIVTVNGNTAAPKAHARVVGFLNIIRNLANVSTRAKVNSKNDFPTSAGIASSASAFASLSLAASKAAGLNLDERQLSILARKGSGSACRSIPCGFVEWKAGTDDESSYAYQIAPPDHWDFKIITVIFNEQSKEISSSDGHRASKTSPFYNTRLSTLPHTLEVVKQALLTRDFRSFGLTVEKEAISMHVIAMTAQPNELPWMSGIYYWSPVTLRLILAVQEWRRDGLEVYFTIDAGPNVHFLCEGKNQNILEQEVRQFLSETGGSYFVSDPAKGAWLVD